MTKMKTPNGVYTCLKEAGQRYIKNSCFQISTVKEIEVTSQRDFGFDLRIYDVDFRVRIELLTNCEQMEEGNICFYLVRDVDGEEELEPFNVYPESTSRESLHSFTFKYVNDSSSPIEYPHAGEFTAFFSKEFPKIVAMAAIEIPLDKL